MIRPDIVGHGHVRVPTVRMMQYVEQMNTDAETIVQMVESSAMMEQMAILMMDVMTCVKLR